MNRKTANVSTVVLFVACLALALSVTARAQSSNPIVIPPSYYDVSPPLWEMAANAPASSTGGQHIIPLRHPPQPSTGPATEPAEDPALQ